MTKLAHESRGSGPALVLLHAFPFDRRMWSHELARLSEVAKLAELVVETGRDPPVSRWQGFQIGPGTGSARPGPRRRRDQCTSGCVPQFGSSSLTGVAVT